MSSKADRLSVAERLRGEGRREVRAQSFMASYRRREKGDAQRQGQRDGSKLLEPAQRGTHYGTKGIELVALGLFDDTDVANPHTPLMNNKD